MKKLLWMLFALLALSIGFYPAIYLFIDRSFGLLSTKSPELLGNALWNIGFYAHIFPGGIAMLTGWSQFIPTLRNRYPAWHRGLGKIYVASVLVSGLAGFSIGFFATGGPVAAAGFVSLAVIWLYTTMSAYNHIRKGQIQAHEKMMRYSYAACFAAVTLRIWFPLLFLALEDYMTAYRVAAWMCWVPNLMVVRWWRG